MPLEKIEETAEKIAPIALVCQTDFFACLFHALAPTSASHDFMLYHHGTPLFGTAGKDQIIAAENEQKTAAELTCEFPTVHSHFFAGLCDLGFLFFAFDDAVFVHGFSSQNIYLMYTLYNAYVYLSSVWIIYYVYIRYLGAER